MKTSLSILVAVTCVSAALSQFIPFDNYVYRHDHGAPKYFIQSRGAQKQPLTLSSILNPIETIVQAPVPLPYVANTPIAIEDDEDDYDDSDEDLDSDDSDEGEHHGGGGSSVAEEHHRAHGEKTSTGYNSEGHHAKGVAGTYAKDHESEYFAGAKGEEGAHHDEADAYGKHGEGGEVQKGGKHGHKSHSSKGEDVTGYHKVYNKEEFKKDHDFYDVDDKSGHFNKHGLEQEEHRSEGGAQEEGDTADGDYSESDFGKSGFHGRRRVVKEDAGYSREKGNDLDYKYENGYNKNKNSGWQKEHEYEDDEN